MLRSSIAPVAVGTVVLAAMAVSEACPPGAAVHVQEARLPWHARVGPHDPLAGKSPAVPAKVTLRSGAGQSERVVRVLSQLAIACGSGGGEVVVKIVRGVASATVTGLPAKTATCVVQTIEATRFPRIDDTFVHVAIELR